jgi:hypothetical protein
MILKVFLNRKYAAVRLALVMLFVAAILLSFMPIWHGSGVNLHPSHDHGIAEVEDGETLSAETDHSTPDHPHFGFVELTPSLAAVFDNLLDSKVSSNHWPLMSDNIHLQASHRLERPPRSLTLS